MIRLDDPRTRGMIAYGLLALVLLSLLVPFVWKGDARHLSGYATGPEEVSRLRASLADLGQDPVALVSGPHLLDDVDDPTRALLLVLGPERRYDASEVRAILRFLDAGGSVLLADETGFGTDVAREAGFAFGTGRVLDTRNHLNDPRLVVATPLLEGRPYRILLNSPTTLVPLRDAAPHTVLAATSSAQYPEGSYLDANGNGEIDIQDPAGPFPLLVKTRIGAGTLLLAADTGLFMDAQADLPDYENLAFLQALVRGLLPEGGEILLDESRHAPPAHLAAWNGALRAMGRALGGDVSPWVILALLGLAGVLAWTLARRADDWSHHEHRVGDALAAPPLLQIDAARIQRMARRQISEKYNIPMEEVATMTVEELVARTGDRARSEAAAGQLRTDPSFLFPPTPQVSS